MSLERLVAEIESRAQQQIASEQTRFEKEQAEILADRHMGIDAIRSEPFAALREKRPGSVSAASRRPSRGEEAGYEYQETRTQELLETVKAQLAVIAEW